MLHLLRYKFLRAGQWVQKSPLSILLAPPSWIWAFVSWMRNWLYDREWLKTWRVDMPVVSIGNLCAGGSGKTPLTILLARQFPKQKTAIIARGYGAKRGELNDEMRVIARHLPEAMLYQGSDRVKLAQQAEQDGADWILMDDGFQHRRLHRDWDLVLVSPRDFFDGYLPRGRLRESVDSIKRADVVFSGADLEGICPTVVVRTKVTRIVDRFGAEVSSIEGKRIALFSGIGHPARFRKTVEDLGALIVEERRLADHEPFTSVEGFYRSADVDYVVCTEKDFVKLGPTDAPVIWIEIETEIAGGHEEWEKLIAKIGQRLNN